MANYVSKGNMIGIINTGAGNFQSVANALEKIGVKYSFVDSNNFKNFENYILPGVGSFKYAMNNLEQKSLIKPIKSLIDQPDKKILGICLGMQLLYENSEEDNFCEGLKIIKGRVKKIKHEVVPNVGWRQVKLIKKNSITQDIPSQSFFYHVHSYACYTDDPNVVIGKLEYNDVFDVIINFKNFYATQFHPEKSQNLGIKILKNFLNL